MKNLHEFAIKFLGGNNRGIALIVVQNITTGKYIDAIGTSYDNITDIGFIPRIFDTYCSNNLNSSELYLMYWISLVDDDKYDITVSGSGTKNVNSSGYDVSILAYYEKQPWVDSHVNTTLRFWHTDFSSDYYDFIPLSNVALNLLKTETFIANGVSNTYSILVGHAYEFTRVSINGVWLNSYDTSLSFGSNSPNFDNEVFDANKRFTINFLETPPNLATIMIEYKPYINTYRVLKVFQLPQAASDSDVVDTKVNLRELDWSCEII